MVAELKIDQSWPREKKGLFLFVCLFVLFCFSLFCCVLREGRLLLQVFVAWIIIVGVAVVKINSLLDNFEGRINWRIGYRIWYKVMEYCILFTWNSRVEIYLNGEEEQVSLDNMAVNSLVVVIYIHMQV